LSAFHKYWTLVRPRHPSLFVIFFFIIGFFSSIFWMYFEFHPSTFDTPIHQSGVSECLVGLVINPFLRLNSNSTLNPV
jgi:hypothetical protein